MIRKLGRWKRWIRLYVPGGGVCDYGMEVEGSFLISSNTLRVNKRPALDD
jgi:hypothetical protein